MTWLADVSKTLVKSGILKAVYKAIADNVELPFSICDPDTKLSIKIEKIYGEFARTCLYYKGRFRGMLWLWLGKR